MVGGVRGFGRPLASRARAAVDGLPGCAYARPMQTPAAPCTRCRVGLFALALVLAFSVPVPARQPPVSQPGTPGETPPAETKRLNAWLDQLFKVELARSPQLQTRLGMHADLDAYGRWDDESDAEIRASHERQQRYLANMRKLFDLKRLDDAGRTTYRFVEFQAEMDQRLFAVRESAFVFSPMLDPVSEMTTPGGGQVVARRVVGDLRPVNVAPSGMRQAPVCTGASADIRSRDLM